MRVECETPAYRMCWATRVSRRRFRNFLDGTVKGKGGVAYAKRKGFCLGTLHFPDSPNHRACPATTLKPGAEHKRGASSERSFFVRGG